jgi:hypothetical protein
VPLLGKVGAVAPRRIAALSWDRALLRSQS